MDHLILIGRIPANRDLITGIAAACKISKSSNAEINLHIESDDIYITIKPVSYDMDVIELARLKIEMKKLESKNG